MKESEYKYIIFNNETKQFYEGDGYLTDELKNAEFYNIKCDAQNSIDDMDESEKYEIWPIEIIYRTRDE